MLTVLPLSCLLTLFSKSPLSLTIRIPTRPLPPSRLSHTSLFHRIPPISNIVLTHPVSAHTAPAPPLTHDYNNIRSQQQHTKITTTYEANTRTTINTSIISSTTFTPSYFHHPQLSQSLRLHHPPPTTQHITDTDIIVAPACSSHGWFPPLSLLRPYYTTPYICSHTNMLHSNRIILIITFHHSCHTRHVFHEYIYNYKLNILFLLFSLMFYFSY